MIRLSRARLRVHLVLLVLLAVLPGIGLILYADSRERQHLAVEAHENALGLVRIVAADHERLIEGARHLLIALAQLPQVRRSAPRACSALFADLLKQYPLYTGFAAATPDGAVFCSAPPLDQPVTFADRAWYRRLVETRAFVVGEYQIGRISGRAGVILGYPVLGATPRLQGLVATGLDLAWLNQLATEARLPPGAALTVIDRTGTILARHPDPEQWVGRSFPEAPISKAVLSQKEGTVRALGMDGIPRLYAFAPLGGRWDAGAFVSIEIPVAIAFAEADHALSRNLIGLGLVTAVALVAAWIVGGLFIFRPVTALVRGAKRLGTGDLSTRTGLPYGKGEFGQLARAFDDMAEALEQREVARQRAHEELRTANRALTVLSECNQTLLRAADESTFLLDICRIVVEAGGYRLAWVGFAEPDERKTVHPVAQWGYEAGYLDGLHLTWAETERGRGPTGTAIRTGKPVIARHIPTDPTFAPWRAEASQRGYASSIALPLTAAERTLGALNIYATKPDAFDLEEVTLLTELANDVVFGLATLRTRIERTRAEEALRQSEKKYRELAELLPEVVFEADGRGNLTFANRQGLETFGYSEADLQRGVNILDVIAPEDRDRAHANTQQVLRGARVRGGEYTAVRKDGGTFPIVIYSAPVMGDTGPDGVRGILVDITERKHAEAALATRTRQLEAVRAVTAEITRELDLTALLKLIVRRAAALVGVGTGAVHLWDEAAQLLVTRAWIGYGEWRGAVRLRLGEGVTGTVAQRREGMIVNDYRTSPYATPLFLERARTTAILGEPLLYGDRLLGVIVVTNDRTEHQFTEDDRSLLGLFAAQAAIAIENARLFVAEEAAAHQARSLYEIAHSLTTSLDVSEVLRLIALKTTELLGTPHAQVVLWDEATQTLRLGAAVGTEAERVQGQQFRLGAGVNGIVAETRAPLLVNDYQTFPQRVKDLTELVAVIGVPLLYRDRFFGVLTSHTTQADRTFGQEHLTLLTSLAAQAAVAIENARLYQAERRRAAELQGVMEVSHDVVGEHPLGGFLTEVVTRAVRLTQAASGTLYLWEEREQVLRPHAWTNLGPFMAGLRYALGQGITGAAAAAGRGLIWNDYLTHPQRDPQLLEQVPLVASMAAPLISRARLLGVLTLNHVVAGQRFSAEDLRLLETFASQMAIAIENARLYEDLRLAAIQLEAKVEDRTRDLQAANAHLEEAMRQVEAVSRHKSDFLANMSHELRTPLNSVLGFAEILRDERVGPLTEKQARYLAHIASSGQHLLQLISDILDVAKVEAGKIVLQPETLSVAPILDDILVIARGLAHQKAQTVEAEIAPDLPALWVDPIRFKQILFNLLSNAVKFTPERGRITLTARQVTEDRRPETEAVPRPPSPVPCLELRVTDPGIGIRAEDLPRLFQEFVQLQTTQAQHHEGTGLGLALTKRLVELHGGRIWADSEGEGRGSTFTLLLPFEGPGVVRQASPGPPSP